MMFADPFPSATKDVHAQGLDLVRLLGHLVQPHGLLSWLDDGEGHLLLDANWKRAIGVDALIVPVFASWALVHADDRAAAATAWDAAKRNGGRIDLVLRIGTGRGRHVRAHVVGRPYPSDKLPVRYVGTCRLMNAGEQPLREITGQELKAARALAGLSVGQLAHLSTVSIATIARLEASLNVRRHNQIKIIDALGKVGVEMFRDVQGAFSMRLRSYR